MVRNIKSFFVAIFIGIILFALLFLFKIMLGVTIQNQLKYPTGTDCDSINKMFNNDNKEGSYYN